MAKELLMEIGTEEIPAAFLPRVIEDLADLAAKELSEGRLSYGEIKTFATPRRLALIVTDLNERQETQIVKKTGPATRVAWDKEGHFTPAALGFARSQGVEPADLKVVSTDKGDYLAFEKEIPGEETARLLPALLPRLILALPFRKSMRWGYSEIRFARPIHWLLALYGGETIPFVIDGITSGSSSQGHRFLSPAPFSVRNFAHYLKETKARFVVVDPEERRKIISDGVTKEAAKVNGKALVDPDLLSQVVFLTEYPEVLCGQFEEEFLDLPREVLATVMMSHQKYFPIVSESGDLLPYFLTVTNTPARDRQVVRRGNEKVIRARLADARFFFKEDQKIPLEARLPGLGHVVFHALLGSVADKVARLQALSLYLTEILNPDLAPICERAAVLAKADLLTQMVGELPELQGIMGREYALRSGEDSRVARAIYEHYLPVASGGELPASDAGAILSIADKIDSIVGFFSVKLPPTGTADPYALRRQALGIINIILERKYPLDLDELIDRTLSNLAGCRKGSPEEIKGEVLEFFRGRLSNQLIAQGYSADGVEAVACLGIHRILSAVNKIEALAQFRRRNDFADLVATFKRVENIIKGMKTNQEADPTIFRQYEEKELHRLLLRIKGNIARLLAKEEYLSCLVELASLKKPVDAFFDAVLVMAKEEEVRGNRLALLTEISCLISSLADFSRIQTS